MGLRNTVEYLHMALRLIQENLDIVDMNLIVCKEFRMVDLEMMKALNIQPITAFPVIHIDDAARNHLSPFDRRHRFECEPGHPA